ncbi:MAG: DoxX family protein [Cytophagaceae bacterium]|nr:DoxX family protein [Cytophagaceae bacterium]
MELIRKTSTWRVEHQESKILAGLRIVLGLILLFQGIHFIQNTGEVQSMLSNTRFEFGAMTMAHLIALFHLAGGVMVASGFLTRLALLFQLPILIGAVLFSHTARGVYTVYSEFWFALVVLLLMCFFLYYGSGVYSLDTVLRRKRFYE